ERARRASGGARAAVFPPAHEVEHVLHVVEEVGAAEPVHGVYGAGGEEGGVAAEEEAGVPERLRAAALERDAPQRAVRERCLDEEVEREEGAGALHVHLALEEGVLAEVLHEVPRELVLE